MRRLLRGLLLAAALPAAAAPQVLQTPRHTVRIDVQCAEGEVTCDRVQYEGTRRRDGAAITLQGRTRHAPCADGRTPCRFLGWEFRSGGTTYFVSEDGELRVTQGGRVLLRERGQWQR